MECGGFLQSMGSETTILIRSLPLRTFDQDMAKRAVKSMELIGCKFVTKFDSSKGSITKLDNGKLSVSYFTDDKGEIVEEFDTVLTAIGRQADVKGINLDAAGVKYNSYLKIPVNTKNETNLSHIFAIGDMIEGSPELTPVAVAEGK